MGLNLDISQKCKMIDISKGVANTLAPKNIQKEILLTPAPNTIHAQDQLIIIWGSFSKYYSWTLQLQEENAYSFLLGDLC